MCPGSRQGGKRVMGVTWKHTHWALYKEARAPGQCARRGIRQASDEEAYTPGQRPGGGCTELWMRKHTC